VSTEVADAQSRPGNDNSTLYRANGCTEAPGTDFRSGLLTVISVARAEAAQNADAIVSTVAAGCSPGRMALTADGNTLWVAARGDKHVLAFSTPLLRSDPNRALIGYADTGGDDPVGIALLQHEQFLAVANSNRFTEDVGIANLTILSVDDLKAVRP